MARLKLVLDTRESSRKSDGTFPIALRVFHLKTRFIKTGHFTTISGWDANNQVLKKSNSINNKLPWNEINMELEDKLYGAKRVLRELGQSTSKIDVGQLVDLIKENWDYNPRSEIKQKAENQITLKEWGAIIVNRKLAANRPGTASWYECCINSIINYNNGNDLKLYEINLTFLKNFEAHHLKKGNSPNTVSIQLRGIRALYNSAIEEDQFSPLKNAFKLYKMPKTIRTRKRAIGKDKIIQIRELHYPYESSIWHAKNYALIMFYCRGLNFADLVKLKVGNIVGNRLNYGRSKTGTPFSIKITDDLKDILDYYTKDKKVKDYLFPTNYDGSSEHFQKYKSQRRRMNERLRIIARDAGIEGKFTTYSIRHSWATIAKYLGISTELISESLGHSSLKTTQIYLKDFDSDILDEVNAMVVS